MAAIEHIHQGGIGKIAYMQGNRHTSDLPRENEWLFDASRSGNSIVEQAGRVDILLLPVDSEYHLLAHDEIEAYRSRLAPSVLIPMHYRHSDLESDPDSPDDLGGIDGWLKGRQNVLRLDSHIRQIDRGALPDVPLILVFEHSPAVRPPS